MFQENITSSYLTFCSLLDCMPPWLQSIDTYTDAVADEPMLKVRNSMFWMQKADLIITHYYLRLSLARQAFEQRCPGLLGLASNHTMFDLRVIELAQELLAAINDIPYDTLYISGESLVSCVPFSPLTLSSTKGRKHVLESEIILY